MTKRDGYVVTTIHLPDELHQRVAAASKASERNFSQQVRWLLAVGLEAERPGLKAIQVSPAPAGGITYTATNSTALDQEGGR